MSNTSVTVAVLPKCDFCDDQAHYDTKIPMYGSWANVCERHFKMHRCSLGLGKGQRLVLISEEEESHVKKTTAGSG